MDGGELCSLSAWVARALSRNAGSMSKGRLRLLLQAVGSPHPGKF
jgi:hypothetical protein